MGSWGGQERIKGKIKYTIYMFGDVIMKPIIYS